VRVQKGDDELYKDIYSVVQDLPGDDDEMSDCSFLGRNDRAGFNNVAVEKAFDRLMKQPNKITQPELGGRVRVGLITNDITPRVFLQPSEGSKTFKKRNERLREKLEDMYNFKYPEDMGSLPDGSEVNDRFSVDSQSRTDPLVNCNAR